MSAAGEQLLRLEIAATDALTAHIRNMMDQLIARQIKRGAANYRREIHLPRLLGRSWESMSDAEIVARLQRKLFAECQRLRTGHWTGDGNRLSTIKQAIAGEKK